ncbi:MAG: stage V sporulation protein AD, partial [Clostridia bacterium]|nr:stage V sporulation protein AD [Clostridia bacterium]
MNSKTGKGAYTPGRPVYIVGYGSAAGEKESEGPFGALFDYCAKDDRMNMKSFELAETHFTEKAVAAALKRSGRS